MIKQLFKILWHQRRINGWIYAELLVVLATVWTLMDGYWVDYRTYHAPMGYDITNVWRFKLNDLSEHAPGYVPDSLYTSSGTADLLKLMDQIRRYPAVECVCVTFYSCPYSNGNSWLGIRPVDGDTTIASQQSFQVRRVTPDYFDVFRLKDSEGRAVSQSIEGLHNPLVISKDMEDIFYHGESGKGRRVLLAQSGQEMTIAAVCQPIRNTEYERSEPCDFQVLDGAMLNDNVEMFRAFRAELCVRMKQEQTKAEMNGVLTQMGDQLTVNNLRVYGVQSLSEMRDRQISFFENEASRKMYVLCFLLVNVFFGIIGTFWLRTQNRYGEMGL
ncbi:MAG: multidrug ABC transporter substrate-binding protein, partial [Tannerellaceae bacterium]